MSPGHVAATESILSRSLDLLPSFAAGLAKNSEWARAREDGARGLGPHGPRLAHRDAERHVCALLRSPFSPRSSPRAVATGSRGPTGTGGKKQTSVHDISISIKCLIGVYISSFGPTRSRYRSSARFLVQPRVSSSFHRVLPPRCTSGLRGCQTSRGGKRPPRGRGSRRTEKGRQTERKGGENRAKRRRNEALRPSNARGNKGPPKGSEISY